jgi:hypothetical protein
MAFFDEGTSSSVLNVEAVPTYIENYHEAALAVVAETESNYNALMMAIGIHENKQIRESGEAVYTEGALSSFWEKVKKFFVSLWAKIKGIFNKFMSRFDAQFKGGKAFFDKYKKQLADKFSKIDKDKVKFNGYKFQNHNTANAALNKIGLDGISIANIASLTDSEAEEVVKKREDLEDMLETFRGSLIGSGKYSATEFNKELFEHFRGGESSKSDQDGVDFQYIAGVLGTDKLKKNIETSYKTIEKDINEMIKQCEKAQKSSIDTQVSSTAGDTEKATASKRTAAYPIIINALKSMISIKQVYIAAQMKAISDEISQAKQFASQVIRASVKEDTTIEHYMGESADDIFGTVKFQ